MWDPPVLHSLGSGREADFNWVGPKKVLPHEFTVGGGSWSITVGQQGEGDIVGPS